MARGTFGNIRLVNKFIGKAAPKMGRVEADVAGEGDLPPRTVDGDLRGVLRRLRKDGEEALWPEGVVLTQEELYEMVRSVVVARDSTTEVGEETPRYSGEARTKVHD